MSVKMSISEFATVFVRLMRVTVTFVISSRVLPTLSSSPSAAVRCSFLPRLLLGGDRRAAAAWASSARPSGGSSSTSGRPACGRRRLEAGAARSCSIWLGDFGLAAPQALHVLGCGRPAAGGAGSKSRSAAGQRRHPGETHLHAADEHVAEEQAAGHQHQIVPDVLAARGLGQIVAERVDAQAAAPDRSALSGGASIILPGLPPLGVSSASCSSRALVGRAVAELVGIGHVHARCGSAPGPARD